MLAFLDPRLPSRFWALVIPEPNSGCWLWLGGRSGGVTGSDYGMTRLSPGAVNPTGVHRLTYEAEHGVIPRGRQIDHACEVTMCCNPAHLAAVTPLEHASRARERTRKRQRALAAQTVARERQRQVTHDRRTRLLLQPKNYYEALPSELLGAMRTLLRLDTRLAEQVIDRLHLEITHNEGLTL